MRNKKKVLSLLNTVNNQIDAINRVVNSNTVDKTSLERTLIVLLEELTQLIEVVELENETQF